MDNQTNLISISTVATESDTDKLQIIAMWKNTEKKTVSPANRIRAIQLPVDIWSDVNINHAEKNVADQLKLHILDSIAELAKDYLSTICEESQMLRKEVPQSDFSLASLLAWNSERAAMSGRLNGDEIKNWLTSSETIKSISSIHGEAIGKAMGEQFIKLASPVHGLTPEKATKILTNLWNPSDAESNTGLRIQLRLTAISKKTADSANVLDSIL
jgi:hypothetical protein